MATEEEKKELVEKLDQAIPDLDLSDPDTAEEVKKIIEEMAKE